MLKIKTSENGGLLEIILIKPTKIDVEKIFEDGKREPIQYLISKLEDIEKFIASDRNERLKTYQLNAGQRFFYSIQTTQEDNLPCLLLTVGITNTQGEFGVNQMNNKL